MTNYEKGGGGADWGARGPLTVGAITHKTSLGEGLGRGAPETIPSSQILHKMTLSLSMSMLVNGDYSFYIDKLKVPTHERAPPFLLCHFHILPCGWPMNAKTTWQNMEMDTEQFRNL